MSQLKELGQKSLLVFGGNIFSKIILMLSAILFGRLLGPAVYGQFTYIVGFISFFLMFGNLGLPIGLNAFIAKYNENNKKNSAISFALTITLIMNISITIALFLSRGFIANKLLLNKDYLYLFMVFLPTIIMLNLRELLFGIFNALKKVKPVVISAHILLPVLQLVTFLILYKLFGLKIGAIITAYIFSITITLIYLIISLYTFNFRFRLKRDFIMEFFVILKYSFPLLLNGIIVISTQNIDIYMLGYLVGVREVGIYKMALQIGNLSSFALLSVNSIFPAITTKLYNDNDLDGLSSIFKITTKWIGLFNLLLLSGVIVLNEQIMNVIGVEYIIGKNVLVIITIGQLVNSISGPVQTINAMTGKPQSNMIANIIAVVVNIILNCYLIPIWGMNGAAIATATSLGIANVFSVIFAYYRLKLLPFDKTYLKNIIPFIISLVVGLVISKMFNINFILELILIGSIIVIVYLSITWLVVCSIEDRKMIKDYIGI